VASQNKVQKISLLRQERSRNVELILSRIKLSNSVIVESLFSCNPEILSSEKVEALINCLPQEGEAALYKNVTMDR
jgi:diaphanous 1